MSGRLSIESSPLVSSLIRLMEWTLLLVSCQPLMSFSRLGCTNDDEYLTHSDGEKRVAARMEGTLVTGL